MQGSSRQNGPLEILEGQRGRELPLNQLGLDETDLSSATLRYASGLATESAKTDPRNSPYWDCVGAWKSRTDSASGRQTRQDRATNAYGNLQLTLPAFQEAGLDR